MIKIIALLTVLAAMVSCGPNTTVIPPHVPAAIPVREPGAQPAVSDVRPSVDKAGKASVALETRNHQLEVQVTDLKATANRATQKARESEAELKRLALLHAGATPAEVDTLKQAVSKLVTDCDSLEQNLHRAASMIAAHKTNIADLSKALSDTSTKLAAAEIAAAAKDGEANQLRGIATAEIARNQALSAQAVAAAKERDQARTSAASREGEVKFYRKLAVAIGLLLLIYFVIIVLLKGARSRIPL